MLEGRVGNMSDEGSVKDSVVGNLVGDMAEGCPDGAS